MRSATAITGIVALCCEIAIAQVDTTPRFDAASIKRSAPDSETFMKAHPGGRVEISRATLRTLTAFAWRLQPFQISGGPAWVRSEYFSINTKAVETPSEDRLFLMMQTLFKERFSLMLHFETAERPVYILVPGKTGRKPPQVWKSRLKQVVTKLMPLLHRTPPRASLSAWDRTIWKGARFGWLDLRKR